MSEFLSTHRADFAAIVILILTGLFVWSIYYGLRRTRTLDSEQVFGDPERTLGGWFWAVCGVSALLLVWFYYSWGAARAFFPHAANELCQVGKLHEAVSPLTSSLPIETRYSKSKTLLVRNMRQVDELRDRFPGAAFNATETTLILRALDNSQALMSMMAT
ncbi:MAG: ABC transporter permease, partial [Proteobacteria bacterium]|nr:ABC transporter permease [Pseudomonadota bacterium]